VSRQLRIYLIACIAIAFAYLLWHAREPLRLNIGDPWSDANVLSSINYVKHYGFLTTSFSDVLDVGPLTADSYRYIHYPPFAEIIYGAIGKYLGVSDIGTFRLFGLAFSGAAMWLLFSYARRMYSDRVALVATMLFSTSLLWLMYADSIHQAPVMQASGFLALWGLVRAIESKQRRHYAAAVVGCFACFFTSYDYWVFLPAAVLVTLYLKCGNPFARGQRNMLALCAAGCMLGIVAKSLTAIGAVGWHEFLADLRLQFFERSSSTYDRAFTSSVPTMIRRITMVFTPLAWIAIVVHGWRALRAPTIAAAIKDTAAWMLLTALVFFNVFSQLAASQMLPSQVLLPFYAIGSALILDRMLDASALRRGLAIAWLGFAPAWGLYFMVSQPRSALARGDVAKVNAYFAANDRNDFMMSNLISIGHIQASFERHHWTPPAPKDPATAYLEMLATFEVTGTDYVHAAIFTTPESRFIDKCLWPLAMPHHQWSVTGWPYLYRAKANRLIQGIDTVVHAALAALEAKKVMHLGNFDLYRLDRTTALAIAARRVPAASTAHIDLGNFTATRHELLGWGPPHLVTPTGVGASPIVGYETCSAVARDPERANPCNTVLTNTGLEVRNVRAVARAQLLVRIEQSCDLHVRIELARPTLIGIEMNGFSARQALMSRTAIFTVPASAVRAGINELTLEHLVAFLGKAEVQSVDFESACR
jgi:hypothetical protein